MSEALKDILGRDIHDVDPKAVLRKARTLRKKVRVAQYHLMRPQNELTPTERVKASRGRPCSSGVPRNSGTGQPEKAQQQRSSVAIKTAGGLRNETSGANLGPGSVRLGAPCGSVQHNLRQEARPGRSRLIRGSDEDF